MKEPIFIKTSRGDRTNILANFTLLSKESFIKAVKDNKGYRSQFRYGYLDGTVDNLVSMRLSEFEEVFPEQPFTQEEITKEFRKEISEKYGKHAIKVVTLKNLERGGVYKDKTCTKWVYLGLVEKQQSGRVSKIENGYGFVDLFYTQESYSQTVASVTEVLKGIKSNLIEKVGQIELQSEYESKETFYYGRNSEYKLKLL